MENEKAINPIVEVIAEGVVVVVGCLLAELFVRAIGHVIVGCIDQAVMPSSTIINNKKQEVI